MTALTRENLANLIQERKELFKKHPDEAVAAFNREVESTNIYNGRQVLELIQNADDAQASEMIISLNKVDNILSFYNDGDSFSYEGIKSLLIANLSNKIITSSFIGNKGLGFRSILNWAKKVTVRSAGLKISFSQETAQNAAKELDLDLETIRKERHLSDTCIPFPVLGIPEVEPDTDDRLKNKGCCIDITFDPQQYLDSIERQLSQVQEEVLLFLNHINTIRLPDGQAYSIKRGQPYSTIGEHSWEIIEQTEALPPELQDKTKNEVKMFSIKMALASDTKEELGDHCLFNYLPTKERVALPFLLHATVELESSRNHIIDCKANRYILKMAAQLISKTARRSLSAEPASWKAYLLMTPLETSSSSVIEESLYQNLRSIRDSLPVYPTVSNEYCLQDAYSFFTNEFSAFWQGKKPESLCCLLLPVPDPAHPFFETRIPDFQEFSHAVNAFSIKSDMLPKDRADFIVQLLNVYSSYYKDQETRLNLMTDRHGTVITDGSVFTPKKGDIDYKLPDFVNLSFIQEELYDALIERLKEKIKESRSENEAEARCLARILKQITPLSDYDKSAISAALVSIVNQRLESQDLGKEEKIESIRSMVSTLIEMRGETSLSYVRLVNQNDEIVEASKLLLDTPHNRKIFGDRNDRYVKGKEYWGFGDDESSFNHFMRLLGVNAWTERVKGGLDEGYFKYLTRREGWKGVPAHYFLDRTKTIEYHRILHRDWLENLGIQEIVLLLANEPDLAQGLREFAEWCFEYKKEWRDWRSSYNFIRYQLTELPALKHKVFDGGLVLSQGFSRDQFSSDPVQDDTINEILKYLQSDVSMLDDEESVEILNSLETLKLDEKRVRAFYDLFLQKRGEKNLPGKVQIRLLCQDGKYHPRNEVYYTNNTRFPTHVIQELGVYRLSFPSRQGEEKVCDFFGIQALGQIHIRMVDDPVESELSGPFSRTFEGIKPSILLYALNTGRTVSEEKTKKSYASALRKCCIHLITSGNYMVQSGSENGGGLSPFSGKALGEMEFVRAFPDDSGYYLCIGDETDLERLKRNPDFCNAFAEILGMTLKLETRNDDFIYLLQDCQFKMMLDKDRFSDFDRDECSALMGLSREERQFWSLSLQLLGKPPVDADISKEDLYNLVEEGFPGIKESADSVDFFHWNTETAILLLKKLQDILGKDNASELLKLCNISLYNWNAEKYRQEAISRRDSFKCALWNQCSCDKKSQKSFLQTLFEYDSQALKETEEACRSLDFDVINELKKNVREVFGGIELDGVSSERHDILYDLKTDDKEWPLEIRSLLYFEGHQTEIEKYISSISQTPVMKPGVVEDTSHIQFEIVDFDRLTERKRTVRASKQTAPVVHTRKDDLRRIRSGEEAEKLVKSYLVENKIPYQWKSSYSDHPDSINDAVGYDFDYQVDGIWRFLEVKVCRDDSFILSENEYQFAMNHLDSYDMALVSGDSIRIIKSFFKGAFTKSERDYYISFGIQS